MFARIFGRPTASRTARRIKRTPTVETLEGRQLLSLGAPFPIDSPNQPAALKETAVSATNSNGMSVVAWVEQRVIGVGPHGAIYGAMEIRAQLYNSSGAKVGPEIVAVNGNGHNSYEPSVSINASGSYVISWTQVEPNGNTFVLAQEFNSQSVAIGNVVLVGVGTFFQSESSVAMDPQGGFVVAYTRDTNNNNPDVFAKDYYGNGQLRTVITVAASPLAESHPSIAMDPEGNFDIAYQAQSGARSVVDVARYSEVDRLLGVVSVTTGSVSDFQPSIAMDESDDLVVAYRELTTNNFYNIYATRINQGIGPQTKIAIDEYGPASYNFAGPSVAFEPSGDDFAVAYDQWLFYPGGTDVLNVAVVGAQNTVTQDYVVGSGIFSPSISSLPSETGEFLLTYVPNTGSHVFGRFGTYR